MTLAPEILHRLRNTSVGQLIRARERDGFVYRRAKGTGRVYRHPDGRRVAIHYHHSGDTLPIGTLRAMLNGTAWTEDDLERLGLL